MVKKSCEMIDDWLIEMIYTIAHDWFHSDKALNFFSFSFY